MKGCGLYSCSGTASSPLLSSTCCSWRVRCTLNVVSPLSLLVSGFAFLHHAVVNKSKIQALGGQELDWGDAVLSGIMDGVETSADTWGGPPLALPGSNFDRQTIHRGLLTLNAMSSAIGDGLRIQDTYKELLEDPTEASHLSTKVAGGQGK